MKFKYYLKILIGGISLLGCFNLKRLLNYVKDASQWVGKGGKIDLWLPVLRDYNCAAGTVGGHYFHQDLLVASKVFRHNPVRHIDVGSRLDGFVAHLACFREVEVYDVRDLPDSGHKNIVFKKADMSQAVAVEVADSISCLHAIEHFGLGRYSDPINPNGHETGIENLIRMLKKGGALYISFPISKKTSVHFNAHRLFHPLWILDLSLVRAKLELVEFSYVDDIGNLHVNVDPESIEDIPYYGCGIYHFLKI